MRKIYSLVLMATMLLIGANAWADGNVCSLKIGDAAAQEYPTLQQAFDAMNGTTNSTVVLTMLADAYTGTANQQWRTDGSYVFSGNDVTWDLGGFTVTNQGEWRLRLHANNYTITGAAGSKIDFASLPGNDYCGIYLYGETSEDASVHTNLTIGANVTISSYGYAIAIMHVSNAAFNVKVDVYGTVSTTTGEAAVSILGTVNKIPSENNMSAAPTINVYNGATVSAGSGSNMSGIYAAGYGVWNVQGTVEGATGIYAKAGKINLTGATVTATGAYETIYENNNGVTGGGSAIVMDGNSSYAGHMELHVTGATTVTSTNGYAIEELVTSANESQTDALEITSGEFNGKVQLGSLTMTPDLGQDVQINGSITGGTYNSDITQYMGNVAGALQETAPNSGIYQVVPGCIATLNDFGLATFSSPNYNVVLPDGLTAWIVTGGLDANKQLTLSQLAAGAVLPEDAGLILSGTANTSYNLYKSTADAANVTGNKLEPATEWAASYKSNAYILHGNELWIYEGDEFKPGKAFLPADAITIPSAAPKRISMVFGATDEATAVENVEIETIEAQKFIENGQVLIKRGENIYNAQGQIVK